MNDETRLVAHFPLPEGNCSLSWPQNLSRDGFENFRQWLELVLKTAEERVAKDEFRGVDQ